MNTPIEENMFEITLSQEAANYLLRIFKILRWMLGVSVLTSIIYTSLGLIKLIMLGKYDTHDSIPLFIQYKLDPIMLSIAGILSFFQVFYYFRFTAFCKKGIETKQAEMFNNSFRWLYKNAALTLFLFSINVLMGAFYCYMLIEAFLKASHPA